MRYKLDETSFGKGQVFENFILNEIFVKTKYDLIHRTNNFSENSIRFSEESKNPDFKFRCKETQKEFYVEAKYRSGFNSNNKLNIFEIDQFNRFKKINDTECPVFIVIGYEGLPKNPKYLSFIRIDKLKYLALYSSALKEFEIEKAPFSNKLLNKSFTTIGVKPNKINTRNKIITGVIFLVLIFLFYSLLNNSKSDVQVENNLKNNIKIYYLSIENNNLEVLDYYINSKVDRWYSDYNISLKDVKNITQNYLNNYPYHKVKIDWSTFRCVKLPNGNNNVSYNIDYTLKGKKWSTYKKYKIKINAIWNKENKIVSMYEEIET